MRQHLLDLFAIQQIDLGIRDLEKRRDELPTDLDERGTKLQKLVKDLEQLEEQRDALEKESKSIEGVADAETHKVRKWEKRLAEIRNQREYLALSREVEGTKRATRSAEEKLLEMRGTQGELTTRIEELRDQLAEDEVDRDEERKKTDAAMHEANSLIEAETKRREVLVPKVPKDLYRTYEFVRAKRLGLGIVPVIGGCCQGCNMRLPPQLYNNLQRVNTIEQCPSCRRVIFWEGILPAPDANDDSAGTLKSDGKSAGNSDEAVEAKSEEGVEASP